MDEADRFGRIARRAAAPPVGRVVRRPVHGPRGADGAGAATFPLTYVRTSHGTGTPIVVLPGGPGLASVLPYRPFRKIAAARGLDVIMVEHRGVGLSRRDDHGHDLPVDAVTVEAAVSDVAAVLDDAGVDRAVVYGSSYGTYLAQGFGLRHPDRVAGMVLDSPVLSARLPDDARANLRRLLWDGADPATAHLAAQVRALSGSGAVPAAEVGPVVQIVYEFLGPAGLGAFLTAARAGRARRTWAWLARLGEQESTGRGVRYVFEPDLVVGIAFGELGFGTPPDGHPLDPQTSFAEAGRRRAFDREPYDLPSALPSFDWPIAAISGDRDLRTPRPVAERAVALAPDAVLVAVPDFGHSTLDGHPDLALLVAAAVGAGTHHRLPALAPRLAALPRRGRQRLLGPALAAALRAERLLPAA
ncbi:alpha/beta hydrolase [Pseudonocardia humida]|uniref:Alpha/beta fold hydrolase n=1 Tax=Pseudonocardia humida TaxID=2800819 RepID=A0ABT1A4E1_9PSEU|nr:alpha/beta hydrolase [Pseudonocardia humida]MCO1657830.1 alpha/beta fold hydrolase [Pseudonocardia humida]